jgi:GrpB-like predicted nucleotidyltransferase (UPF0157 family)
MNDDTDKTLGLKRGTVALAPDHDAWAVAFAREKRYLQRLLGDMVQDLQHIGSTAIPNVPAKPIIDMAMGVSSWLDVGRIRAVLEQEGYQYRANGSSESRTLFVKGPEERRTHHLHVIEHESDEWRNVLSFRDHLRAYEEYAKKYAALKTKLAAQFANDRDQYTKGKRAFIDGVIARVLAK